MSVASQPFTRPQVMAGLLALAVLLVVGKPLLPSALIRLPEFAVIPFADAINTAFNFARDDLGLLVVTRWFADGIQALLDATANLLYGKNRFPRLGPIPWTMIAATAFFVGYALRGWRLGALAGGTFVWIAVMGQWKWTMETLSVIVVAVPVTVGLGLCIGVAAWRWRWVERVLDPLLNIAQSLPHFAYMIPVVVFIGVGPKAGAIVTIIFAIPPMIRMTLLGMKKVPPEVVESGQMCGANRWQSLRHVRLPTARHEVLIGVNQVIMQCLAMVVLASFIGMPGLGQKLLQLLQALKIGRSVEIGITIVFIAVVLDQCSKAWTQKQQVHFDAAATWYERHRLLVWWAAAMAVLAALAYFFPLFAEIKRTQALSVAKQLDAAVGWLIGHLDPITYALRAFLIQWVLIPMRDAYLWLPFTAVLCLCAAAGWRQGGLRSAVVCVAFIAAIAASGWWDRAMITAYMVSFAVLVAAAVGLPLGIWAAGEKTRARRVLLVCDTAQTFPSFIYLIPVVMLFGVNDVAAIFAVIAFAAVPMTRYTIEGLLAVPPALVEAADMAGADRRQKLRYVLFPMALPIIATGFNQTIMFSLFMVIIAAFIGTQDLGQEMQRALSSTDVGKGLVLGLCVAFMGLTADHLLSRWSARRKRLLAIS